MKELKCTNCGAPLEPSGKCAYCGARFRIENNYQMTLLQIEHPKVVPLICETIIGNDVVARAGEAAAEIAKHDMARKMALALEKCMDIKISNDYMNDAVRVRGKIRVVLPGVEL